MVTGARMGMTIRMPMSEGLITLAQWLSPSFPVGAFAYSHGLEHAISDGRISDARDLLEWLTDLCEFGAGYSDVMLLAHAYLGDATKADAYGRAMAASQERLKEADLQGAAFIETVNTVWALQLPRLIYPVAVGAAASVQGLPLEDTARLYLHATLGNLTSVAVRLVPLGQTDGQRVVAELTPRVVEAVQGALGKGLSDLGSACFLGDIAAMRHETMETRIFRT